MSLFRFRVCWEEDDQIYRDIVVKSGQCFAAFQPVILKAFDFKNVKKASFFESNERWHREREISSEVLVNKKGATVLSSVRTPVSALINQPEKRFLFHFEQKKDWLFQLTLIAIETEEDDGAVDYPLLVKSEGVAPQKTLGEFAVKEGLSGMEDRFDLNQEDMDEQGFGEEDGF